MKLTEYLWEKIGAVAIASFIGTIYGLIISPIIIHFLPQITVMQVLKVFCLIFSSIGIFSSNFLIEATLGLIYTIVGFFTAATQTSGMEEVVKNCLRSSIWFTLLGLFCGFMVIILYC